MVIKIKDKITPRIKKGKSMKVVGNLWDKAPNLPTGTFMVFPSDLRISWDDNEMRGGIYLARFGEFTGATDERIPSYENFDLHSYIFIGAPVVHSVVKDPKSGLPFGFTFIASSHNDIPFPLQSDKWELTGWSSYEKSISRQEKIFRNRELSVDGLFFLGDDALDHACNDKELGDIVKSLTQNVIRIPEEKGVIKSEPKKESPLYKYPSLDLLRKINSK